MVLMQSAPGPCNLGKVRAAQRRRTDKMSVPLSPARPGARVPGSGGGARPRRSCWTLTEISSTLTIGTSRRTSGSSESRRRCIACASLSGASGSGCPSGARSALRASVRSRLGCSGAFCASAAFPPARWSPSARCSSRAATRSSVSCGSSSERGSPRSSCFPAQQSWRQLGVLASDFVGVVGIEVVSMAPMARQDLPVTNGDPGSG